MSEYRSKHVVISGYCGYGNLGDEAVLAGIVGSLTESVDNIHITVLSGNPKATARLHPTVEALPRYSITALVNSIRRADLVISGGGSLLQDVTSARSSFYYLFVLKLAQLMRRKTMVYAQGIGPLLLPVVRLSVAAVLNRTNAITVRDYDSAVLLREIGVREDKVRLSADPSVFVEPDIEGATRTLREGGVDLTNMLAVSLRPWPGSEDKINAVAQGISAACSRIAAQPVFVIMQSPDDFNLAVNLPLRAPLVCCGDPRIVKGVISLSRMVVAMRLHSLIFAASSETPFLPIVYDPKVASFAKQVTGNEGITLGNVESTVIEDLIVGAWERRITLADQLRETLPELRSLASVSVGYAKALIEG